MVRKFASNVLHCNYNLFWDNFKDNHWSIEAIHETAGNNWSLEGDNQLLNLMKSISKVNVYFLQLINYIQGSIIFPNMVTINVLLQLQVNTKKNIFILFELRICNKDAWHRTTI